MDNRFICRASQLSKLMSAGRTKSETFGETAKGVIKEKVLLDVFGFNLDTSSKYTVKGVNLEDTSIELLNNLLFADYKKNDIRKHDNWFTGECDVLAKDHIRDMKTVWSLASFPMNEKDVQAKLKSGGYYEQGQVYMHLFERDVHYVDFVLLPTPLEQLRFASDDEIYMLHELPKSIPAEQRVKTIKIERNQADIDAYKLRVDEAQELYQEYLSCAKNDKYTVFEY